MNAKKETKNKKKIPSSEKASEYFNLSKYKKRILTTIIIVLLLGTLAIGTWGLLKAKLLVDEDIIIKMNLTYSSLNLKHGESVNISIENEITTTFLCESQCSIILKKIDDNTIVYQSTEIVKETNKIIATFNISADKLGYGQELYSYQISCKNLYSNICPAPDTFVKKNALISLNYAPNELELEAKGQLEKNLAEIMTNLITTSSLINQNKEYVAQFKIQNKTEFYDKILQQEKSYHTYERFINSLNDDSVKDYLLTNKKIEAASILERTANLLNDTNNLNKILNEQAKAHNLALQLINNITKEKQLLDELSQTENINKFTNKTTNLNHYTYIENQTNKIIYKFNNNEIKNYAEIIQELQTITKTIQELKQDYIINFKTNYLQLLLTLNFIETDLCIANNQSEDCRNLTKLDNSLNIIQDNASLAQNIILNTNQCTLIKELSINDTITKETQVQKRENIPIPELEIIDQEKLFIDYSLLQFLTREINTRNLPLSTILQEYKEEIIKNINNSHNSNLSINSEYYPTQYNKSSANLIIPLTDDFENLLEQSKNLCETSYKIKLNFLNLHEQPIKIQTPIQAQASEFKIKNINPICCAYNFCYSCNTNMDLADTPLLLLHGHSFYTKHTPDYSTNIFSNMLTKLETDEKYIPGGLISSDKTPYSLTKSEFGKNPIPLAAKGTYYYVALYDGSSYISEISKSENIDTYAIRLKDVIDELKYITGKQKIDVVAHSMGGLVLRRYMQLFGDDSINKAILIGTPNHGLNNRIYDYCKLLGYEKECEDMHHNSSLIKTLNDPNNQPSIKNIYTIIGIGCGMDNDEQGDGIVTIESASLSNSKQYIVNGTCPLTNFPLHNELVNVDKYPEVYDIIEKILKSN